MLHFSISNPAQVTIYSILGETVHTKRISQEGNNVNIQTLSKGLYLVNVKTGNQSITRKMIKN